MGYVTRYFIFSIGHFFSTDLPALKINLTKFYTKHNCTNTGDEIWNFLASKNETGKTHLHDLRMGGDLFDFWKKTIQTQFPIQSSNVTEEELFNEFKAAWLSMCEIKQETISKVKEFISYLKEHTDTTFILLSHTNHAHFESIQQQVQTHFGNQFPENQIKFMTSMDSKKENHPDTLRYAFENDLITLEADDEVISCLNTIQGNTLSEYITSYRELSMDFDLAEFESCFASSPRP